MYQNIFKNRAIKETLLPAVLNSYSVVFFLNNKLLAIVIMLTTFINFFAGLSGLLSVMLSVLIAYKLGFDKLQLKRGVYTFNALLVGIGLGTFFNPGIVFFALLALASLMTLMISVSLGGWFFKNGLPFLSIPFVLIFWIIVLPTSFYESVGLTQKNIFWINEVYDKGGNTVLNLFKNIDSMQFNKLLDIYLRSLSSIIFQNNLITGILIAVALLISSRIFFSLSVIGFLSAFVFAEFLGPEAASITYYNIGANYIMIALAVGGFFVIPSRNSYLWSIILIPLTSIVLLFCIKLSGYIQMPVFSLPFSIVTILFVHFLRQRVSEKSLILTPIQHYSPETDLYTYNNNKNRYARFQYVPIHVPFWGEWCVAQGYNGEYTHKGEWNKALDFTILDIEKRSFKSTGLICEDYYCYGKPVIAPADGVVEEIIDYIDDNQIGKVDTINNWGNSIIIRHISGVYTQLSHLKKGSFKVGKGAFVKRGDVLASCGNSGRSPEPHLHFQVQSLPFLGSRTIDYPISYYNVNINNSLELHQFTVPVKDEIITDIKPAGTIQNAFDIVPNSTLTFRYNNDKGHELTEHWDSYTDTYNFKYLHCRETDSSAYYVYDQGMFYFTEYYGTKKSLLYYFFLSAYKVLIGETSSVVKDNLPMNMLKNMWFRNWITDFAGPFVQLSHVSFNIWKELSDHAIDSTVIKLKSEVYLESRKRTRMVSKSTIIIQNSGIKGFTYEHGNEKIEAVCIN
jgi:urea transporter